MNPMGQKQAAPYGSWKSPITSDLIVKDTIGLVGVFFDVDTVDDGSIFWLESRPSEAGRNTLMTKSTAGTVTEMTPSPYNVRTRVHEYGGAPAIVFDGTAFFSNFADNLLYRRDASGAITPLTSNSNHRYADGAVDVERGRLYWVREDHTESDIFAMTSLIVMDLDGANERIVVQGNDFYSSPRLSPDGKQLAYLTWNHPNMPWDETELWVGDIMADGQLSNQRMVAGGAGESVIQPVWSPEGRLYFVSDKSNWWNLRRIHDGVTEEICPMEAEFGSPSWVFGTSNYTFIDESTILCTFTKDGLGYLARLSVEDKALTRWQTEYKAFGSLHAKAGNVALVAASPTEFPRIIRMKSDLTNEEVIKSSSDMIVDDGYVSLPRAIEYPTEHGRTAHAIYYAPYNADYDGPTEELPPLVVHVHGGPTGSSSPTLNLATQYFTSRGFAVIDVNYGGSTGYGREYRDRLKGNWGVVDVEDCTNAVRYLVSNGEVDGRRVAISGGSAGGYTTLASLVFTDVYSAGASHFGLSELEIFATETHKFESRYMDSLLGPYPEAKDIYYNRSPINFIDSLSCPVIFFQGLDDKIVPPNQAQLMVDVLRKKGMPVAYVSFEGEGHGFRMAKNIKRSLDGEFYFYGKVFGFVPADDIEPVPIENL